MKKWIHAMKALPTAAMDSLCMRALKFAATRRPKMLIGYIMERATEMGTRATMAILDREGIHHCRSCPERFGLMKAGQGTYACRTHAPNREERAAQPVAA